MFCQSRCLSAVTISRCSGSFCDAIVGVKGCFSTPRSNCSRACGLLSLLCNHVAHNERVRRSRGWHLRVVGAERLGIEHVVLRSTFLSPRFCCTVPLTEIDLHLLRIVRTCLCLHQERILSPFPSVCTTPIIARSADSVGGSACQCRMPSPPPSPESVSPPQWLACIRPCVCSRTEPHSIHLGCHFPYPVPYQFLPVIRAPKGASHVLITYWVQDIFP